MENKKVLIPIDYEYLLSNLFGKSNYHAISGNQDIEFLRRTFTKIFKSIKRSIELNIYSADQILKDDLKVICENFIEDIKKTSNPDSLNIKMNTNLTKIIFLLIGRIPNNWNKRKTNFNKEWMLDRYRNVNFTSNYRQRTYLIIENFGMHSNNNKNITINQLWDKLNYDFHNDYFKFVNWFKENFFNIYKKLF